ncbi:MAG TPA: bifunctional diaminohydroxyphosphoribosylaminopyrimidine deaminase/5-amino-6-(5-phosphoribosylamino)uracil reductase RibD [Tepidisphaeraceae bacterium]|jgi:diaminohydroxyphosphoribosylaminopyrimidine deaminase/5-amino-6-(5-phosphoribosylamino)uracil reductase|nr:bifunctional diaminohydroxyphosphoribosylaminopyrimidine deaminase/5-amino-6-(5-phosphoribosylamino)uracil reductase RibD [Tepidisphaeraceae bacterium]
MTPDPNLIDAEFIRRAIGLAQSARGRVEPNPMVGCVIVKDGRIIGQGCHQQYGGPHAEPNALAACSESPTGATAYVTLEPCCHLNKQTPPCAPRVIAAGIARVVYGCLDPNPDVNGRGVAMMRHAGVQVDGPVLEAACKQLIAPFIARTMLRRPYVTLKWAETADGHVAAATGEPRLKITGPVADRVVHALRARCDAIAVGTNTVLADDPLLTARDVSPARPLLRVVLSNTLKLPIESRLVASAGEHAVIVFCAQSAADTAPRTVAELQQRGVEVIALPTRDENRFSFADVLTTLHARRVTHLLIEPGPTLARHMIPRNQVDRIWVFRSRAAMIETRGLPASPIPADYALTGQCELGSDLLSEYLNPHSAAFFAADPSADLRLAGGEG